MTSLNGVPSNTPTADDMSSSKTPLADNPIEEKHGKGSMTWRGVLSHRAISKIILSENSPIRDFLSDVINKLPRLGRFMIHLFDDRIHHQRVLLDAVNEEERAVLHKRQTYLAEADDRRRSDAEKRRQAAELRFTALLAARQAAYSELAMADIEAARKTAQVGMPFVPPPLGNDIVGENISASSNESETVYLPNSHSDPENATDEGNASEQNKQNVWLAIWDKAKNAVEYVNEVIHTPGKRDVQEESHNLQNAELQHRLFLREQPWMRLLSYLNPITSAYNEIQARVFIGAVAAENGIPYYEGPEFAYKEKEKNKTGDESTVLPDSAQPIGNDEIRELATHRRLLSPLMPAALLNSCTTLVGILIALSLALIFHVVKPEELRDIEKLWPKLPIFIFLGGAVAAASRYAVMLPFVLAGEMHGVVNFTQSTNRDAARRSQVIFVLIGVLVLFLTLCVDYAVEFGGIAQLVTSAAAKAENSMLPSPPPPAQLVVAQYLAPLIVLFGYLIYCGFEGFIRGRDGVAHRMAFALSFKKLEEDKKSRGLTQSMYQEAVETIHIFLSKRRECSRIDDEIQRCESEIVACRHILNAPLPIAEMSLRATRRIEIAHEDTIGATRQFDELAEKTFQSEIQALENEMQVLSNENLELAKQRETLRNECELISHSKEHTKELAKTQFDTDKMREEWTQDTVRNERHKVQLAKADLDANAEIEDARRKRDQHKENLIQKSEDLKAQTENLREEWEQDKVRLERERTAKEIRAVEAPPISFWRRVGNRILGR